MQEGTLNSESKESLERFCLVHYPKVVGLLGLYCRDRDVAEELAQESIARLCRDWKKVSKMDAPSGWLYRVAINLANSYFRRRLAERRIHRLKAGQTWTDEGATDLIVVKSALMHLGRRTRTVLIMRYYLDLPVAEVARLLDMPEGTVKTLSRRGLARLRDELHVSSTKGVINAV